MSRAPTDLLIERHKDFRQANERYQRAIEAHQIARERVAALEASLGAAETRDRMALGDSIVDGKKAPPSEAGALREELAEAKAKVEAVGYALERYAAKLERLPKENKATWLRSAERELKDAGSDYRTAIAKLTETHDRFADLATLCSFLLYGGQYLSPVGDAVLLNEDAVGARRSLVLEELASAMRREIDEVAERVRIDPNRPAPRFALERMKVGVREES